VAAMSKERKAAVMRIQYALRLNLSLDMIIGLSLEIGPRWFAGKHSKAVG
jgi:hypothetical protein